MELGPRKHALTIVIPAYNEEQSIGSIVEQTLAARDAIIAKAEIASVDVIVVNDGSSDRTAEIAAKYGDIRVISHGKNRGYGAAIKRGFAEASGDLVGFLDADGTCDPLFFSDLCRAIGQDHADVAIGARLGSDSEMPPLRRFGNRMFATIISLWGGQQITDSASGMRVIRRSSLPRLYPLPDGMHFTPAMSSLAIFDPRLRIVEVAMRYSERAGESKLHVVADGLRFLRIIVDTALTYRPLRFLGTFGLLFLGLGLAYGVLPLVLYVSERRIEEWMIYRLVAVSVALVTGTTLLTIGVLGQQTVSVIHGDYTPPSGPRRWFHRLLLGHAVLLGALSVLGGIGLNWRSLVEYAETGHVSAHWIYVLTGGLLVTLGIEFMAFGVLTRVLDILAERARYAAVGAQEPGRRQ